jgi:hypothetical protein
MIKKGTRITQLKQTISQLNLVIQNPKVVNMIKTFTGKYTFTQRDEKTF